jgi:hypothetical protein
VWKIQGASSPLFSKQVGLPRARAPAKGRWSDRGIASGETTTSGPARVPGVHIGHIGGSIGAVEQIRAYWQRRAAVFMHHSLEPGEPQSRLDEILERSHVIFHARACADCEFGLRIERYCERRGKPLILLSANSVTALVEALATNLPLT